MQVYHGKRAAGGVAVGTLRLFRRERRQVKRSSVENVEQELRRYQEAVEEAERELTALREKAVQEVGEANAAIFEIHQMMLADEDFGDSVRNMIRTRKINAAYAVAVTADNFAQMFEAMEDEYMRGRAADVRDISERLVRLLHGGSAETRKEDAPVILLAEDLAPSETVQLDKKNILAFVTVGGSVNSHTAILARTMGIPAVVNCDLPELTKCDGKQAAVDGAEGVVYLEPEKETVGRLLAQRQKEQEHKRLLQELKGKETVTPDGQKVRLYANIGSLGDLAQVLANDAEGIGLFRSEFLYLESEDYPTEEEQFQAYRTVVETMAGKPVIIRTLDIGADKQCPYFALPGEENPAMGMRAIRICLTRPELLKTQLRAIFRASAYGTVSVMYPMITSVDEVRRVRGIAQEAREELEALGIPVGRVEQGIMIETPAAALISDLLAKEVDFFSIGTNDLTQYLLAVDRQNPALDPFYDAHHPALLRLLAMVAENAHREGIWVGICGELGADLEMIGEFLSIGIDELSVTPGSVLAVRNQVLRTVRCTSGGTV